MSLPPLLKAMLPNELWGSCHVVTEGADYRKVVSKGDFKIFLLTKLIIT